MIEIKRIAIYCGSSTGTGEIYARQAYALGTVLAQQQIGIVYGGGKVGLMDKVANGALEHGGEVIGVIPDFLGREELAHEGLTEMIRVRTMHERKYRMSELCDGIIGLPGGYGTMDEFFEMLTWGQLGLHKKPIGLLNINGFYNSLIELIQTMTREGFLKEAYRDILLVSEDIPDLLSQMKAFQSPAEGKWI
jgi:uncharacterized protein (TIGR00730 family)